MNDDGLFAVGFMKKPYRIVKANSGGIRFTISSRGSRNFLFHLLKKDCSHEEIYTIFLGENSKLINKKITKAITFKIPNFYNTNTHDFWLTWFNDVICLGRWNEQALLTYQDSNGTGVKDMIGFVKFEIGKEHDRIGEWNVEISASSPVIYTPMTVPKQVNSGELRWVSMNSTSALPIDALIGGLENEPLYIARAVHRGSLCPGKYVKSKQLAYIPWGYEEIPKDEFEILCGYDAMWIKCHNSYIPENAFIGGYSEVHDEPLFIGRAWVHSNLVVGKVHMLYKTCYLPYQQREVEKGEYEILVVANAIHRGETSDSVCYMKMFNNMQPCLKNQNERKIDS